MWVGTWFTENGGIKLSTNRLSVCLQHIFSDNEIASEREEDLYVCVSHTH
jgi:hypothetical protein